MPTVYFGPYTPDAADLNSGNMATARNVRPDGGAPRFHYKPLPSLSAYSADAMTNEGLGGVSVRLTDGTTAIYAGDSGKLYKLDSDQTWDDQSKVGGYTVTSGAYWWFIYWENKVLAGADGVAPQTVDVDSGTQFADISGSPPQGKYAAVIGPHLMMGNLASSPRTLQWSAAGDETTWTTGGGSNGGTQEFREGGWIRNITSGRFAGYVFQEEMIRRAVFTQDDDHFQFDIVVRDIGLSAPWSLVTIGNTHYFLSQKGFYSFDGASLAPIGMGAVDNTFVSDLDQSDILGVYGAADPDDTKIYWAYKSNNASGTAKDKVLIFDYYRNRWSDAEVGTTALFSARTLGVTLEQIDTNFPSFNMDTLPFSLDDRSLQGGLPALAAFDADKKLSFFSGANLEATLKTAESELIPDRRALVTSSRPLVDNSDATIAIGRRERLADSISTNAAVSQETHGECPQRADGRYFCATMGVPAGENWNKAYGIQFEAVDSGEI